MDFTGACWRVLNRLVLGFYGIVLCNLKMTVVSLATTGNSGHTPYDNYYLTGRKTTRYSITKLLRLFLMHLRLATIHMSHEFKENGLIRA